MDYKKIIKNRDTRTTILRLFDFVPDDIMLRVQYRIKTGRGLNLKKPKRYTEKIQWYKLYYRDPLMAQCVDKFEVRHYVESCGMKSILNECYGVYSSVEEIDFEALPNQFVLKDTLGGGGNSVILVEDKRKTNIAQIKKQLSKWISQPTNKKNPGREWVYDGMPHRIIAEKYISSNPETGGLIDYKFFCFGGKLACLYVMGDRRNGLKVGIYDSNFHKLDAYISYDKKMKTEVKKPDNFDKMCEISEKLSAKFPHARIDLFDQDGVIIFGEITFFSGSGYTLFDPDEFDFMMGKTFILPEKKTRCNDGKSFSFDIYL